MIVWAVNSFKPYKSAGTDGIFPALLQNLSDELFTILRAMIEASLQTGYIPTSWRKGKVIYIPKVGNKPNDLTSSYRPITISSFMLKTAEKILDKHIRLEILSEFPIHKKQFAYQEGKSTSMAVKSITNEITKMLGASNSVIGVSLDIEGAFNNLGYKSVKKALIKRRAHPEVVKWIMNMLETRQLESELCQETIKFIPMKGCSQGGALSPLLWTLVVDEILVRVSEAGFNIEGFADDLFVMAKGFDLGVMCNQIQQIFRMIEIWCNKVQLKINPSKVNLVIFTNKRLLQGYKNPILYGMEIKPSESMKYLGVHLDSKLNFNQHIRQIATKTNGILHVCRQLIGRKWGLSPRHALWLYTSILRPMMCYAANVWYEKCGNMRAGRLTTVDPLQKIHRRALLLVTGAFKTTATDALEATLDLPPLYLFIESEAIMENIRVECSNKAEIIKLADSNLKQKYGAEFLMNITHTDKSEAKFKWNRYFNVHIPKREEWNNEELILSEFDDVWYTDGSKTLSGTGAGVFNKNHQSTVHLGKLTTIFQAEMLAVNECCLTLKERQSVNLNIAICTDNQGVIKALSKEKINSKLVNECFDNLNSLAVNNDVTIIWVPGHTGIDGNEQADNLAKQGTAKQFVGPEPFCGVTYSMVKTENKALLSKKKNEYWNSVTGKKFTKLMIKEPSFQRANWLSNLRRKQLRIMLMFLTGHGTFKAHLFKMSIGNSDLCRFCSKEVETAEHLLFRCHRFDYERTIFFGNFRIRPENYCLMDLAKDIFPYLTRTKLLKQFMEN